MKTIGYAVVGTGYFGAELARIMKEQEGARVVAVYDPENAGSVAEELGCEVETDLDALYSREDVELPSQGTGHQGSGAWGPCVL